MTGDLAYAISPKIHIDSFENLPSIPNSGLKNLPEEPFTEYFTSEKKPPRNPTASSSTTFFLKEFAYQQHKSWQLLQRLRNAQPSIKHLTENTQLTAGGLSKSIATVDRLMSYRKIDDCSKSRLIARKGSQSPRNNETPQLLNTSNRSNSGFFKKVPIWEGSAPSYRLYDNQKSRLHRRLQLISASDPKLKTKA